MLEVFGLSNTELGTAKAAHGVVAMLAYFPGGPLADRFSARKLLALSLWSTAAGGVFLATLPGFHGVVLVWGLFGITTSLLFWAALIGATRDWGGDDEQGQACGLQSLETAWGFCYGQGAHREVFPTLSNPRWYERSVRLATEPR